MSNPAKAVVWGLTSGRPADVSLVLWGVGTTRALRAHWMLTELGVPYISHRIQSRTGETLDPAYLKLNPRHKIPTLQHGALTLTESAAIIHYLAETFNPPDHLFVAVDARQRARLNEWCYFIMNELDGHALYVIRRHVGLKHIYGEAPEAVESAKIYFREQIEPLAPRFEGLAAYLFGERLSVADMLLTTCLEWAESVEIAVPEAVAAYRDRVATRPAYVEAKYRNDPATVSPGNERLFVGP
jgi:glutathione S-transferase